MNNVVPFKTKGKPKEPHPADDLSFMRCRKPKGTGIDYWVVEFDGKLRDRLFKREEACGGVFELRRRK